MKITFRIKYRTIWGEQIAITINGNKKEPIMLSTSDGESWSTTLTIDKNNNPGQITYQYSLYRDGKFVREENNTVVHHIPENIDSCTSFVADDNWRDMPYHSFLYSSAFSKKDSKENFSINISDKESYILFRAITPTLDKRNAYLAISGSGSYFGNWGKQRAVTMQQVQANEWWALINTAFLQIPFEYKFVVCDKNSKEIIEWEGRENRIISIEHMQPGEIYAAQEAEVKFYSHIQKVAGTAIPVFSLRSEGSYGVGDFGDLKSLVDWAVLTHQSAIQILPINDTTITNSWTDSYPYNSISIYAFHPMYIDLRKLPTLKEKEFQERYEKERKILNELPKIDYEKVNEYKREYLRELLKQEGNKVLSSKKFKEFFAKNEDWLLPYAAFSCLRDKYSTPQFSSWPEHSTYNSEQIKALCAKTSSAYAEISFYYYIQYLLHEQLLEASNYAREKGIIFKGDIPIGISRNSVESWIEPYYFNMNGQAGAPPDAFSKNGQNWGFPTYNWDVMEKDNYEWWQKRFRKMAEYFTAYRIDHILGFFRIWEIPSNSVHGLLGQFVPALPMSVNEIEQYGLHFQEEFMTQPFINEDILYRIFGDKRDEVKKTFLANKHHDIYAMMPEYDTQRKIEAYFKDRSDEESNNIKEGLYSLISNVLFVRDRNSSKMYHPRIAVQNDLIFERLSWQEKEAFNKLYNNYFYNRHNKFWYEEAMKKLPVLTQSTDMLVCGEDLGMVPDCVPWVMDELQILSLEIQCMPKNPEHEFGHVWEYPYKSVCTISTHDMSTLRGWWEENYDQSCRYYNHVLGHWDTAPKEAPGWLCEEIVRRHLECPSLLCILSFQDWMSIDEQMRNKDAEAERINVPANPKHYWRYRMHLTIEELLKSDRINNKIRSMIDNSGRI